MDDDLFYTGGALTSWRLCLSFNRSCLNRALIAIIVVRYEEEARRTRFLTAETWVHA
jgi:hypothetical protein